MNHRVSAGFSRRTRHTPSSAYQHGLLTKWVRRMMQPSEDLASVVLRDGYGHSLDWEMWQIPRRGDSAFMASMRTRFPQVQRFFRPQLGNGKTFRFWEDNWSGYGRLSGVFPRLYTLSMDQWASVQQAWHRAWAPALPEALSDQRVAELLRLQELLADQSLSEATQDVWVWSGPSFTVRAVYRLLRDQGASEDPLFL